MHQTSSA